MDEVGLAVVQGLLARDLQKYVASFAQVLPQFLIEISSALHNAGKAIIK